MIRKFKINGQTYAVQIEDLNARPIVVTVDGQRFEILPEDEANVEIKKEATQNSARLNPIAEDRRLLVAPLPGTIVKIFIKPGEKVESGQVVLIIEAMKMKNSIRSVYSGVATEIFVRQGESVAHKQALMKFAETA